MNVLGLEGRDLGLGLGLEGPVLDLGLGLEGPGLDYKHVSFIFGMFRVVAFHRFLLQMSLNLGQVFINSTAIWKQFV